MTTDESVGRRYWDSTNWISLLAEDEAYRADICQNILNDMVAGEFSAARSSVYGDFGIMSPSHISSDVYISVVLGEESKVAITTGRRETKDADTR